MTWTSSCYQITRVGLCPWARVLSKKWIHEKCFSSMQRSVVHSSTFSRAVCHGGGLAALDVIERAGLIKRAEIYGNKIGGLDWR